jgi:hypothetical protein
MLFFSVARKSVVRAAQAGLDDGEQVVQHGTDGEGQVLGEFENDCRIFGRKLELFEGRARGDEGGGHGQTGQEGLGANKRNYSLLGFSVITITITSIK